MSTTTATTAEVQDQAKANDKDYNFRAQAAKYEKILSDERAERERLQREVEEIKRLHTSKEESEEDVNPYVDDRRLEKKLANFGKKAKEETKQDIQQTVQQALYEERRQAWLDQNQDFYDVMEKNANRFMEKAPEVAKTILQMPDTFERAKLVYHTIKTMGIDRPEVKQPSVQDKIDANRRMPYYQPPSMGNAPYAPAGDFSEAGKKRAWEDVQKLKANLRLG
jgi:hypothetical protein